MSKFMTMYGTRETLINDIYTRWLGGTFFPKDPVRLAIYAENSYEVMTT